MDIKRVILPAEADLKTFTAFSPALSWVSDINKQAYFFNNTWLEFTGRQHQEEDGEGWQTGIHPDDLAVFSSKFRAGVDNQQAFTINSRLRRHDGEFRWLAMHGIPAYSTGGSFAGFVVSSLDIHDLLLAQEESLRLSLEYGLRREQALNEELASTNEEMSATNEELVASNEELLRSQNALAHLNSNLESIVSDRTNSLLENQHRTAAIIENAPFPIAVYVGREMRIEFANKAITDVWGKGEDVAGKLYSDILPELRDQEIFSQLDDVFTTGEPFHARNQRIDLVAGGEVTPYYFNYSFTALRDHQGQIYGVMNTAADITDIVRAKTAVERSEKELYNMILQAPVAMCILSGPDHVVTVANDRMIELWGKPAKQVMHKPIFEGLPDARSQGLEELLADVYTNGKQFRAHEQPVSLVRNGQPEVVFQNFVYEPYRDFSNNVVGVIATTTDVTEQVESRKLLEQSYDEQQAVSEELAAGNEELAAMNEELTTINEDLIEAQEELVRSEQLFKSIALNIPGSVVIVVDKDQKFLAIEGDLMDKLGYNGKGFVGKRPQDVSPPERYEASRELYERVLAGESFSVERKAATGEDFMVHLVPLKNEAGEVYAGMLLALDISRIKSAEVESAKLAAIVHSSNDAIISKTLDGIISSWNDSAERIFGYNEAEMIGQSIYKLIPEERSGEEPEIIARIRQGERVEHYETRRLRKDKTMIDVSLSISPIRDGQGNIIGVSKIARDISEKKLEETRKNDFIAMVSHELKTPLTSLTAFMQVLSLKLRSSSDANLTELTDKSIIQAKKMAVMINGFLNISRLESGQLILEKREFEIGSLINDIITETQLVTPGLNIEFRKGEELTVLADPDKISSVVSNLIGNAVKYSDRSAGIILGYELVGDSVQVSVQDNGIGIMEQDLNRLFERYYRVESARTKHISGFGIGLYLSSEIVKRHGGKIWAESKLGEGSTFYFSIPVL